MPTPRLPQVGSDDNTWGDVLNEFLGVSHNGDGTIKNTPIFICRGFLSQSGTNDPIFTPIVDTLEGVWVRISTGTYTLTKTGAFMIEKTVPIDDIYTDQNNNTFKINRTDSDTMTLLTYSSSDTLNPADDVLVNRFINIEIYK